MGQHPIFEEIMSAMTHRERAVEDGHGSAPSGSYGFMFDLPEIGYRDCTVTVQWALTDSDRMTIEGVSVMDVMDGEQVLDPVYGSSLEKALYARLATEALARRDDILDEHRDAA